MATADAVTQALARLRADRPGFGLEDVIDAHWIDWFSGDRFQDEHLIEAVNFWIEHTPARTWPTVAEIEQAYVRVVRLSKEQRKLEAGPCIFDCLNGLVYKQVDKPYPHIAVVPCSCAAGRAKLEAHRKGASS